MDTEMTPKVLNSGLSSKTKVRLTAGLAAVAVLAGLTVSSINKKTSTDETIPLKTQPAHRSYRASIAIKTKIREAKAAFNNNPENRYLSANLISNLVSSPCIPEQVRTVLKNPEIVKAIIASAHDNDVLLSHLKDSTDPVSQGVVLFTQYGLNVQNNYWVKDNVDQGKALAEIAARETNWEADRRTSMSTWGLNRAATATEMIAPGGTRATLELDGICGKKTLCQLQQVLFDMNDQNGMIAYPDKPRTAEDLKQYTLQNSRAMVMLRLCERIADVDPVLNDVVTRSGIGHQVAMIQAGRK